MYRRRDEDWLAVSLDDSARSLLDTYSFQIFIFSIFVRVLNFSFGKVRPV